MKTCKRCKKDKSKENNKKHYCAECISFFEGRNEQAVQKTNEQLENSYNRAKTGASTWFLARTNSGGAIAFRISDGFIDRSIGHDLNSMNCPEWVSNLPQLDNTQMRKFFDIDNRDIYGLESHLKIEFAA